MQFCMPHWDKMREAVKVRGMENLVAESGEESIKRTEREIQGEDSVDTFDPLMAMHWAILNNLPIQYTFIEGCPICNASRDHAEGCKDPTCTMKDFEWMIDRSADDALAHWKRFSE